jgi:hypothetical protein
MLSTTLRILSYFPFKDFPALTDLGEAVLRSFKRPCLQYSDKMRIGAVPKPPEACNQDEFFRALHNVLGFSTRVSSKKWSRSSTGRIDFFIPEPGWGFELIRDGDRLDKHCKRFEGDGA